MGIQQTNQPTNLPTTLEKPPKPQTLKLHTHSDFATPNIWVVTTRAYFGRSHTHTQIVYSVPITL